MFRNLIKGTEHNFFRRVTIATPNIEGFILSCKSVNLPSDGSILITIKLLINMNNRSKVDKT